MRVSTRGITVGLLLGGLLASAAVAQTKIDLDRVTCRQLLEMPREYTLVVAGWLQAYFLDDHADPVVDMEKAFADLLRLTELCRGRPDEEIMAAADELFGKQPPAPPAPPQTENPPPR
jgi:hypothetical protein